MKVAGRNGTKGFTLIELLVVIAIIGLLASIILASLNTAQQKGRDARRLSDIQDIQTALELYSLTCHSYPMSLSSTASNGCPSGVSLASVISPVPTDPRSGTSYLYAAFGSMGSLVCTSYHLGAELEIGETIGYDATAGSTGGGTFCNKGSSPNGAYPGTSGNGIHTVSATNGDFQPECGGSSTCTTQGAWVYDVTSS